MKKKTIAITLFPAIYTIIITSLNDTGALEVKGLMAMSLVVIFPLLILIQAIASALNRVNIVISLGLSLQATLGFLIVLQGSDTRELASTLYYYGTMYSISGIVGFVGGKLMNQGAGDLVILIQPNDDKGNEW